MDEFLFCLMASIAVTLAVDAVTRFRSTMNSVQFAADSVQSYVDMELERRAAETAAEPKGDNDNG